MRYIESNIIENHSLKNMIRVKNFRMYVEYIRNGKIANTMQKLEKQYKHILIKIYNTKYN